MVFNNTSIRGETSFFRDSSLPRNAEQTKSEDKQTEGCNAGDDGSEHEKYNVNDTEYWIEQRAEEERSVDENAKALMSITNISFKEFMSMDIKQFEIMFEAAVTKRETWINDMQYLSIVLATKVWQGYTADKNFTKIKPIKLLKKTTPKEDFLKGIDEDVDDFCKTWGI